MAKPNGTPDNLTKTKEAQLVTTAAEEDGDPRWGTWEELLLACAVNRYGTNNWDSVAVEIQKRSSPYTQPSLTPRNCRNKYLQLTRRFFTRKHRVDNRKNNAGSDDGAGAGSIITTDDSVPLLEELRKLRVAELRRELERYDLSIVSLQSKVERMKEERDRSNSENREQNSSDLCSKRGDEEAAKRDQNEPELKREVKEEPDKSPPSVAGETVSDKDELSANEPVSIDRRNNHDGSESGGNIGEGAKEPDRTGEGREELERAGEEKPVREEDSCYGSSDSVEKEEPDPVHKGVKVEPGSASDSLELVESVAESKEDGGGGGRQETATTTTTMKEECSDVQSSATKSRGDGESDHMVRGSRDRDDLENKRKSPAVKIESPIESQPLIDFLEDLKRHKIGTIFSRRLDNQETSNYKSMIRRHIDLQTVQTRVKEGVYSDSHLKFFRDLLLLVNNATVFFSKNTAEFIAATELRSLISNKMSQKSAKSDSASDKQSSLQKVPLPKKENPEPSESLLLKPKLGGPVIFCRKRSSIAKAAASSSGSEKQKEHTAKATATATTTATASGSDKQKEQTASRSGEEKGIPDAKQPPMKAEEPRITKKRSRDIFSTVSTDTKKNGKNAVNSGAKQTSEKSQPEARSESKNKNSNVDLKKRSAASFLNRMKQSSSSSSNNNGRLLDALKIAPLTGGSGGRGGGGSEQKKNENAKGSGKKEQVPTKVSEAKQTKEKGSSPSKKSLGRPPKKGATPTPTPIPTQPPAPPSGKRNRDGKESEAVATNHKRKRSKK